MVGACPWHSSPPGIRDWGFYGLSANKSSFPWYKWKFFRHLEPRVVRTRYQLTDQVFETILKLMVINISSKSTSSSSSLVLLLKWKIQCKFRECFTKNYNENEGLSNLRLFIFIRKWHLKVKISPEKVTCGRMKIKYVAVTLMILICTGKIFGTSSIKFKLFLPITLRWLDYLIFLYW